MCALNGSGYSNASALNRLVSLVHRNRLNCNEWRCENEKRCSIRCYISSMNTIEFKTWNICNKMLYTHTLTHTTSTAYMLVIFFCLFLFLLLQFVSCPFKFSLTSHIVQYICSCNIHTNNTSNHMHTIWKQLSIKFLIFSALHGFFSMHFTYAWFRRMHENLLQNTSAMLVQSLAEFRSFEILLIFYRRKKLHSWSKRCV